MNRLFLGLATAVFAPAAGAQLTISFEELGPQPPGFFLTTPLRDQIPGATFAGPGPLDGGAMRARKKLMTHGIAVVTLVVGRGGKLEADPVVSLQGVVDNDTSEGLIEGAAARPGPLVGYVHPYDIDTRQERLTHPHLEGGLRLLNRLMYVHRDQVFDRLEDVVRKGFRIVTYRRYASVRAGTAMAAGVCS